MVTIAGECFRLCSGPCDAMLMLAPPQITVTCVPRVEISALLDATSGEELSDRVASLRE